MINLSPPVESWLIAGPYIVFLVVVLIMAWGAGGLAAALMITRSPQEPHPWYFYVPGMGIFTVSVRIGFGLALISWVGAMLGSFGWFNAKPLVACLTVLVGVGIYTARRFALPDRVFIVKDRLWAAEDWQKLGEWPRRFFAVFLLSFLAIVLNSIIGALVPDMNHDPMWYHLSIPQQWAFSQKFDAYPSSLHSITSLAGESLFASIFVFNGNSVMTGLMVAASGLCAFIVLASASWIMLSQPGELLNRSINPLFGPAMMIGFCVPLFVPYGLLVPVQPKNDMIMYLWAAAGCSVLVVPVLGFGRIPAPGWWTVGGFLLGTSVCAKVTSANLAVFTTLLVTVLSFTYIRKNNVGGYSLLLKAIVCLIGGVVAAAAPWLYRDFQYHGVPFYPLGLKWFTIREDYVQIQETWSVIQSVPGSDPREWFQRLLEFPQRLMLGAQHSEKFIFLYILITLIGLITGKGRWRWFAVVLSLQMIMIIGMKGGVETFRLFSPCYFLLCLFMVRVLYGFVAAVEETRASIYLFIAGIGSIATLIEEQSGYGQFHTMQWEYRPVLGHRDVENYAHHAEKGWTYLDFAELRRSIDKDDRVFLLGCTYPFYLHRDTLWNDEAVRKGGVEERFRAMSPEEAETFLKDEKIDVVLVLAGASTEPEGAAIGRFRESGVLKPEPLSAKMQARGWRLYRVLGN